MNIGIDIDEVLCYTNDHFLEEFNLKHNTNFKKKQLLDYYYNHLVGFESKYVINEIVNHLINNSEEYDIIEDSKEVLTKLKQDNKLFIITARKEILFLEKTTNWLKRHFGENFFEEIIFSTKNHEEKYCKSDICTKYNIDIMIEDAPHHALKCADKNIKVFLMNRPWNKSLKEHDNITRVNSWREIEEKLIEKETIEN
jgi:uncharacterized HAD superfamily protein